ncbi:MAG: YibE/F family protein [Deinococcales bacterium]
MLLKTKFVWMLMGIMLAAGVWGQSEAGYVEGRVLEHPTPTTARIQLQNGQEVEAELSIPFSTDPTLSEKLDIRKGQKVELYYSPNPAGGSSYVVIDWVRRPVLLWLCILFLVVAVIVAGFKGLRAFLATGLSLTIVIFYIVPQIIDGQNPLVISLLGVGGILILAIYFVHGLSWSTTAALIGTFVAVVITMFLGILFSEWAHLTGYGSEEAMMINISANQVDLKGLMLAGLLVGALGALTDITIVQASVVRELAHVNPNFGISELYKGG